MPYVLHPILWSYRYLMKFGMYHNIEEIEELLSFLVKKLIPNETTDTVMFCQGERMVLETTFRYPGDFMFHAHQSEFAELGWMGLFRAESDRRET